MFGAPLEHNSFSVLAQSYDVRKDEIIFNKNAEFYLSLRKNLTLQEQRKNGERMYHVALNNCLC